MGLEAVGVTARMDTSSPGTLQDETRKTVFFDIFDIGELFDQTGASAQLGGLVEDRVAKNCVPLEGGGWVTSYNRPL